MEIVPILLLLLVVFAVGWTAFWFIDQGVPPPMRMVAKLIVAVVALIILLGRFYPGVI